MMLVKKICPGLIVLWLVVGAMTNAAIAASTSVRIGRSRVEEIAETPYPV